MGIALVGVPCCIGSAYSGYLWCNYIYNGSWYPGSSGSIIFINPHERLCANVHNFHENFDLI